MSLFSDSELLNEPIFEREFDFGGMNKIHKKAKISTWTPCEKRLKSCLMYMGSKEMIAGALLKEIHKHAPNAKYFFDLFGGGGAMFVEWVKSLAKQGFNVFVSESDGFTEFSGLTPIWHKTKQKGNSRIKKDKSADDYAVMNEFLFKA